ncbi:mitochondrial inner membrane protease subunit 1 isoform X1 [Selaginella moellendorffii]|uniref:mitochondrial inner membrane protease subunit 1 isoform X1 n=1 Tax=Selaginella moellendorffii TaxID=88036 RepID=UPI000D1C49F7|nr:mitochondrial inner membrane protease subunit 1 isoform X1 [Selaginella moellendorffii]|eukprot:XP_024542968.1 mitochondrial inner membrane protease subunit 1 isoform X1 [Selaginella moellendorffii]
MLWKSLSDVAGRGAAIVQCVCFMDVFSNHVLQIQQCIGPSMLPTFNIRGDILVTERLSVKLGKIRVGDVVMARSPSDPRMVVCKRILGLEGDTITVVSDKGGSAKVKIPKGHVWLQGDNFHKSRDSREYGPVPSALLQGRVFYRIWPPQGWGFVGRIPSQSV